MRVLPCLLALMPLAASDPEPKVMEARPLEGALNLDGVLDEPVWRSAPEASGFTVRWPGFGQPSSLDTRVKVLYDQDFLYIGARMRHPKGGSGVVRRLHRRDQDSNSDWFGVYLDSLRDRRTAFAFLVNAAGVQRDVLFHSDTQQDSSWDGVWESATHLDAEGWSVEMRIPLSLLRLNPGEGPQSWGINFSRSDQGAIREMSYWHQPPRNANAFVSAFPELRGLEGLKPHPRREFLPYVSWQRKFETAQPFDDRTGKARAGLDIRLGLTQNTQLDASVRPDFGQVEVDQAVVNLSTYETFFPEKRPFFLEGMDLFQFPEMRLFHSRRIGRGAGLSLNDGESTLEAPGASEIRAAAKITSKLPSGFSWAVLGANTEATHGRVRRSDGTEERREAMPGANAGVVRLQQALDQRGSTVGFLGTYLDQAGPTGREAQVSALDTTWKSQDRAFTLTATTARSDAGPQGGHQTGTRHFLQANRRWKDGWSLTGTWSDASRRFNPNDLGYLRRADQRQGSLDAEKSWDDLPGFIQNLTLGGEVSHTWDQAGIALDRSIMGSLRLDTRNFLSAWAHGGINLPAYDDRELRTFLDPQKKYLRTRQVPWIDLGMDTAGNKPYYLRVSMNLARHEGGPATGASLYQTIKPHPALEVSLESATTTETGRRAYVYADAPLPLTGLRRLRQFNQTLRVAYAFTPAASLQFFSQWLAATWSYRDFQSYVDDRTLRPAQDPGSTAASDRLWNLNAIARWEFRPGSTAFLVYTHGANTDQLLSDRGGLAPWPALKHLNRLPSDDVVQMKVSWLFR